MFVGLDAVVGEGCLVGVDPSGWDPFGDFVGSHPAFPAVLGVLAVVEPAEQGHVVDAGVAAVDPGLDVMSFGVTTVSRTDARVFSVGLGRDVAQGRM